MVDKLKPEDITKFIHYSKLKFPNFDDVSVIFDIGSRHSLESIEFSKKFPNANIYAFEANPKCYRDCIENAKSIERINIYNVAVNNYDGICDFYAINPEKTITPWFDGNLGASSLYKANGKYPHEKYVQDKIEVSSVRLDSWCNANGVKNIDLMWIDAQGAGMRIFEGMGKKLLNTVKIIQIELEGTPIYEGQSLYKEVSDYLNVNGFVQIYGSVSKFGSDFIFKCNEGL
tara:strand:- start:151 stop:840 length:690 start_codon:yes stop_codon:yes gene_type:complete